MNKIAVGPEAAGTIDITASPLDNLVNIADAKRTYVEDLTVCVLDRERHKPLIEQIRASGARIRLILDGDVAPAIATAIRGSGVDVLMGVAPSIRGFSPPPRFGAWGAISSASSISRATMI